MDILGQPIIFEWDHTNQNKNWLKHKVQFSECEQVFINGPLFTLPDETHSYQEMRFVAYGQTNDNRRLFISFTLRGHSIRVISARDMSRKERNWYEEKVKEIATF